MTHTSWNPELLKLRAWNTVFTNLDLSNLENCADWPGVRDYQTLFDRANVTNFTGQRLRLRAQTDPESGYETQVFDSAVLPTRIANWHDCFNALMWLAMPRLKAVMNYLQCIENREGLERTALQNMLTLLDENGLIILTSDRSLVETINHFEWHRLFWQQRQETAENIKCYVIGHALHEKGIEPYIGMTGHALLVLVDAAFLQLELGKQMGILDQSIATLLLQRFWTSTKDLQPFPMLGMPGWDQRNEREVFYLDETYFRAGYRLPPIANLTVRN